MEEELLLGDGAIVTTVGTSALAFVGVLTCSGSGSGDAAAFLRVDRRGVGSGDLACEARRRVERRVAFGVVSSWSGDLAWRAERRSFWRGSSTLMSSLAYELLERERVLRRLRELALLWLSTSMSETSEADSASARRDAASSLRWLRASSSTARRRPYGEIIAEMALSASHSEPCFFFVFSLSA